MSQSVDIRELNELIEKKTVCRHDCRYGQGDCRTKTFS